MSTETKVRLVASVQGEYRLNDALAAVELPRSTWYYQRQRKVDYAAKHGEVQPLLEEIARVHPEYGYRRTTSELFDTYGVRINHKVVQRLHQLWGLSILRSTRSPKPSGIRQAIVAAGDRVNLVAQLDTIEPLMVLYTDFTELPYAAGTQKAYLMPLLDHASKVVFGWAVGERANRSLALTAWRVARKTLGRMGFAVEHMIVHQDQDSVYTSYDWTGRLLLTDHAHISFALDGAKDNPFMEAFFSRFKSENWSLFLDAPTIDALIRVVDARMDYYNCIRRHSSLGNTAPMTFLQNWLGAKAQVVSEVSDVSDDHTIT
jgi:transposase InsO family protein